MMHLPQSFADHNTIHQSLPVLPAEVDKQTLILSSLRLLLTLQLPPLILFHLPLHNAFTRICNIVIILQCAVDLHLFLEELVQFNLYAVGKVGHFVEQTACVEAVGADQMRDVGEVVGQLEGHCFLKGDAEGKELCESDFLLVQLVLLNDVSSDLVDGLSNNRNPLPCLNLLPHALELSHLITAELLSIVQHFLQIYFLVRHGSTHIKKVFLQQMANLQICPNGFIKMPFRWDDVIHTYRNQSFPWNTSCSSSQLSLRGY